MMGDDPSPDKSKSTPAGARRARVLLVEDDDADALLVTEGLATAAAPGFETLRAATLAAAMESLAAGTFDLIILDLLLPNSRGRECVDRVLAAAPGTPVVVLTGRDDDALGREALRAGVQDYLIKGKTSDALLLRSLRYAIERHRVQAALSQREEELRALTASVHEAVEQERAAVAREIHDEIGQMLTGIRLDLAAHAASSAEQLGEEASARIRAAIKTADDAMLAVRRIASSLRPAVLDDLGLSAAIEWMAREFARHNGFQVDLHLQEVEGAHATHEMALFRICQESLTNAVRHAKASNIRIWLGVRNAMIKLRICDNGVGIDASDLSNPRACGLIGMRERARNAGGAFQIEHAVDGGTCIEATIPLAAGQAA